MAHRASKRRIDTERTPAVPGPLDRFVTIVNRGDTAAFLAFFPHTGVVDDEGRRFVAHKAIRRWSDREFIGAKGRMTVTGVQRAKSEVRVTADWKSDYYTGASRFVFVLDGERIQEMRITSA